MKTHKLQNVEIISLRGEFELTIKNALGKIIEKYCDKNLIVNVAKTSLAKLLAGDGANKNITKISFGTNAVAPDVADTDITGAFTKAIGAISYPEYNSVLFNYSLGLAENNGMDIVEFGLVSNDNSLFARKTRSIITKTSDLQFSGTWKIIF